MTCPICKDTFIVCTGGPDYWGNFDTDDCPCQLPTEFTIGKQGAIWAVLLGGRIISTHATRDGAAVSCNQLNGAGLPTTARSSQ